MNLSKRELEQQRDAAYLYVRRLQHELAALDGEDERIDTADVIAAKEAELESARNWLRGLDRALLPPSLANPNLE
jgi:hypothetical protein